MFDRGLGKVSANLFMQYHKKSGNESVEEIIEMGCSVSVAVERYTISHTQLLGGYGRRTIAVVQTTRYYNVLYTGKVPFAPSWFDAAIYTSRRAIGREEPHNERASRGQQLVIMKPYTPDTEKSQSLENNALKGAPARKGASRFNNRIRKKAH